MIIRVQSCDGTKRIDCSPSDSTQSFFCKVKNAFSLSSSNNISLYRKRNRENEILRSSTKTLESYDIKHGDMLFIEFTLNNVNGHLSASEKSLKNEENTASEGLSNLEKQFKEDDVDVLLWNENGLIERSKNEKLCQHGSKAKCVHCTNLEPYDENYRKEHNIKHMSFHAYLRKMTGGIDKGKFAALENISCKIKEGCKGHPTWPNGICTNCQPSAITLRRQEYRHVDSIVFENASIVEKFIDYWRLTGHQRIGFLYGYYEQHKNVPLGIRATVVAIYEPPQDNSRDLVKLNSLENNKDVEMIASSLNLQRIGWIFTDLIPKNTVKGTVKHLRGANTYFLSSQECIMAGYFQNSHPNPCRISPEGYFGSKFITVCVTGDSSNQIHMEGYQISNQCMALVRDNCLLPTKDVPELAFVRETTKKQYVPDVFYTEKDNFGNEIKKIARLLPVEYLLVDVPVSAPVEQQYTFNPLRIKKEFPIENRSIQGYIQDFEALSKYLNQFTSSQFLEAASDFHFLLYIATMEMLPFRDTIETLLKAIKTKDQALAIEWTKNEKWATIEQVIVAQDSTNVEASTSEGTRPRSESTSEISARSSAWSCSYCTFQNPNYSNNCEMCGLPHG